MRERRATGGRDGRQIDQLGACMNNFGKRRSAAAGTSTDRSLPARSTPGSLVTSMDLYPPPPPVHGRASPVTLPSADAPLVTRRVLKRFELLDAHSYGSPRSSLSSRETVAAEKENATPSPSKWIGLRGASRLAISAHKSPEKQPAKINRNWRSLQCASSLLRHSSDGPEDAIAREVSLMRKRSYTGRLEGSTSARSDTYRGARGHSSPGRLERAGSSQGINELMENTLLRFPKAPEEPRRNPSIGVDSLDQFLGDISSAKRSLDKLFYECS